MADELIIFDTAQYTKNDWRNRNKIKTTQGAKWLTVPCIQKSLSQKIMDTVVSDPKWNIKHWASISQNYTKAPFFKDYRGIFEECYLNSKEKYISQINFMLMSEIIKILKIETKIRWSTEFHLEDGQTEKIISICQQTGAQIYLSGPAAKLYFDESLSKKMGVSVEWMDYTKYPEHPQLHPPFSHEVSILDLIFNTGPEAKNFMKSFNK
jgi:hypothetical protein